jgi:hypothetical protein
MICAIWSIPDLSNHFKEIINPVKGITWCSSGEDLQLYLKEKYKIDSFLISAGVSSDEFYPTRNITKIKRLGLNGVPFTNPGWDEVKRPQMLIDIAKGIKGSPVFIHNKPLTESLTMYNDIDMYICTSTNDRGPYGIAEAAFCKIPVISTETGLGLKIKSIKTFNTVDEAIQIINNFNKNPHKLKKYIDEVYAEITAKMNWSYVADTYWRPIFENHKKLNKR